MAWFSLTTEALNRTLIAYALPGKAEALLMWVSSSNLKGSSHNAPS